MEDLTNQIFNEEYTPKFVEELCVAFIAKYPFASKWDKNMLVSNAISEERIRRYYSQPSEIISAHLIAQHDEDRAKGWSTE